MNYNNITSQPPLILKLTKNNINSQPQPLILYLNNISLIQKEEYNLICENTNENVDEDSLIGQGSFQFLYFSSKVYMDFENLEEEHIIDQAICKRYNVDPNHKYNIFETPSFINRAKNHNNFSTTNNMITMNYLCTVSGYIISFLKYIQKTYGNEIALNIIRDYCHKYSFIEYINLNNDNMLFHLRTQDEVDTYQVVQSLYDTEKSYHMIGKLEILPDFEVSSDIINRINYIINYMNPNKTPRTNGSPDNQWVFYHIDFLLNRNYNVMIENTGNNWKNLRQKLNL